MLSELLTASRFLSEEELGKLLRKDLRFTLVFLASAVPQGRHLDEVEDFATELLISKSEFRALRNSLLKHGYWELNQTGVIRCMKSHVDLGELSLHEFTHLSMSLLGALSENGPCNYENLFVVTNESLKKEFYSSVNRSLKQFVRASRDVSGDRIVAWNHMGIDFGNFESGLLTEFGPRRKGQH